MCYLNKLRLVALCVILNLSIGTLLFAQEESSTPLDLTIGTIRTEAEAAAIGLLVEFTEDIGPEYLLNNCKPEKSNWLFDISPSIELQTGEADAFNRVIAKLVGNYIRFDTTRVAGIVTPKSSSLFHVFPFSVGFEADRKFDNVSFLLEAGYVPFHLGSPHKIGLKTKVGLFLQTGYKFEVDDESMPANPVGGAIDESEEGPNSGLFRVKLDGKTDLKLGTFESIRFMPRIRLWFDLANFAIYYGSEAVVRFDLAANKSFDLKYEKGSGAPNFNEGEQFSANITVAF